MNIKGRQQYAFSGPADHLVGDGSKRANARGEGGSFGGPTVVWAASPEEAKYLAMVRRWGPPSATCNVGGTEERYRQACGIHQVEVPTEVKEK